MRRVSLFAVAGIAELVAGCHEPAWKTVTLNEMAPVVVVASPAAASGWLELRIGKRATQQRGVQYIRVLDWEQATATLVNADATIPPLSLTAAANVDAQLQRSASLTFSPVKPMGGYTLSVGLQRRDPTGAWQEIASGSQSGLTIAPGGTVLSVPLTLTALGQLEVSVPAASLPPVLTVTDYYPTSGSVGMRIQLDGTGFVATPATNQVAFNGTAATVYAASTSTLQAVVPAGATSGPIGVTVYGRTAPTGTFSVVPSGTVIGTFATGAGPSGVATDAAGNIWVANKTDNSVTKLSRKGVLVGTYGVGAGPTGVTIDGEGNVWVANTSGTSVSKLDSSGNLLNTYGVGAGPMDIAFDGAGNAWVTVNGIDRLAKITPGGVITTVTTGDQPRSVAIDSATGDIWLTSRGDSLSKFDAAGVWQSNSGMGAEAWGLALDLAGGFVWGTDFNNNNVHRYTLSSGSLITKTNSGDNSKELVLDLAGNAWVAQPGTNKLGKMSTTNTLLGNYTVGSTPTGLAVAASGAILVTNYGSNTLSMVAP